MHRLVDTVVNKMLIASFNACKTRVFLLAISLCLNPMM